jgi:hypothetical protein
MNARSLTALAIAACALAGCTTTGEWHARERDHGIVFAKKGQQSSFDCNTGTCMIELWVECPSTCKVHTDTEFVAVASHTSPVIHWNIVKQGTHEPDTGFKFAANGIDFGSEAAREFDHCGPNGGQKFMCRDNQTNPSGTTTVWKYQVNIVDASGSRAVDPYDPWIINR